MGCFGRTFALIVCLILALPVQGLTLRVGVYDNYPLVYVDKAGKPAGLHVDILNAIAQKEGWTLDYRILSWSDIYTLTERGLLDVATSMVMTEERRQWFDFNRIPVATLWGQVVLPAGSPVKTLQALDGARVGVLKAGINGIHFQKLVARAGLAPKIVPHDTYQALLKAIQSGELDAGVINSFYAINLRDYPGVVASDIVFSPSRVGFGFPKGQHEAVRERIDSWLTEWKGRPDSPYGRSLLKHGLVPATDDAGGDADTGFRDDRILWGLSTALGVVLIVMFVRLRRRLLDQTGQLMATLMENRELTRTARHSDDLLQGVANALPDLVWIMDDQARFVKRLGVQSTHLADDPEKLIGMPVEDVMPPPHGQRILDAVGRALESGETQTVVMEYVSKRDRKLHAFEVRISPVEPRDVHRKIIAVVRDITHEKTLREQRDMDHRLLEAFAHAMPDLGFILTVEGVYVAVIGDESLLAAPAHELIGRNVRDVLPKQVAEALIRTIQESERTGRLETFEYTLEVPAGTRHFEARISVPRHPESVTGQERHAVLVSRDITERIQAEAQIRRLAFFDDVTGLPNRKAFQDNLERMLLAARRKGVTLALLMLDLDDFKAVNDTWGHPAGDLLLREVAQRIRHLLRAADVVARLGGDEFVIIQDGIHSVGDIAVLCGKLMSALEMPVELEQAQVRPRASLGIAISEGGEVDSAELIRRADLALYRAKEAGKGQWAFYDERLSDQFAEQVTLMQDLEQALESQDQLFLVYQPQVDNETGRIVGVEALLRWQHPERGLIAPTRFIPQIEDSHLIHPLGERVIQLAAKQLAEWDRLGVAPDSLAVNISAAQFRDRQFASRVLVWLEDALCDPARFELELTETALLRDIEDVSKVMGVLSGEQIRFSLDDFGTGYSSMVYLQRLPFYKLKIDKDFIRGITVNSHDREIVRAMITLARNLGITCVAEGVETAEQLAMLRAWGCHLSQGYYFFHPMAADELTAILTGKADGLDSSARLVAPDAFVR